MRKPKTTSTTIVYFTIKRRPESSRQGDERGRVWFHRYAWLGVTFKRAPSLVRRLSFNFDH
ncbi:hypothetical protein ACFFX4_002129 [Citrobacter farmeri]